MKVYVAGRTTELDRVRSAHRALILNGHEVTYDWTQNVQDCQNVPGLPDNKLYQRRCAANDVRGVRDADVLLVLCSKGWIGTLIEVGIALGLRKPVILVDKIPNQSVFFELELITLCEEEEILEAIEAVS